MRRPANDGGDTLVEILVALAVLSIGIVALTAGLTTNFTATGVNRDQAQAETALTSAAEHVKGLPVGTLPMTCPGGAAQTIDPAAVPRDSAFVVTYGPAAQIGTTPCSRLVRVPVTVAGKGFDLRVEVVRRS